MPGFGEAPGSRLPDERPVLYYITDRLQIHGRSLAVQARRAARWGVDYIQIREKDLPDRELYALACRVLESVGSTPVRVLINARADIALAAGAHGVHLPARGMRASAVRSWTPEGFLIGVSAHSVAEARRAGREGADYALFGPVFYTPSKAPYGPPLGLACLRRACGSVSIPVLGLGGIRPERVAAVLDAGAAGVAGITLFQRDIWAERVPPRFRSR